MRETLDYSTLEIPFEFRGFLRLYTTAAPRDEPSNGSLHVSVYVSICVIFFDRDQNSSLV